MSIMAMNLSYIQMLLKKMKMRGFEADSDGNGFIECVYLLQSKSTNDVITQPLTILAPVLYICWKQSHSLRGSERSLTGF